MEAKCARNCFTKEQWIHIAPECFQSILLGAEQVFSLCTSPKNRSSFFGLELLPWLQEGFTYKVIFKGQAVNCPTPGALL